VRDKQRYEAFFDEMVDAGIQPDTTSLAGFITILVRDASVVGPEYVECCAGWEKQFIKVI
jgi:hypothetical protein